MKRLIGIALALLLVAPVSAQSPQIRQLMLRQMPATVAVAGYTGPGDIVTFAWWGGLRGYSAAYSTGSNPAVDLVDQAGANAITINIKSDGTLDAAAISAWVAAHSVTTIKVTKVYDQTGNANHASQVTLANMPVLTANVLNTSYGMTNTTTVTAMLTTATFTQSQPYAVANISQRAGAGNGVMTIDSGFAGAILEYTTATNLVMGAGTNLAATVTGGAFHAVQSLYNGASSVIGVDGTETNGNAGTNSLTAYRLGMPGDVSGDPVITGVTMEGGYIAGTISSGNRTALNANMHAAYGGW